MMFRFAYPVLLILLFPVVGWLFFAIMKKPPGITHSMTSGIARLGGSGARFLVNIPLALKGICLLMVVLASARPQLYNVSREIRSPGVDIMLTLDASGSMQALDFKLDDKPVSRLTAVKKVVSEFS